MFGFGKKEVNNNLYAPVDGQLISIEKVNDPVFSTKVMGQGFAVIPENDEIVSPVSGKVTMVAKKSKHAVGFEMDNGFEVLIHMGIDTVELKGEPFELNVSEGQKISHGEKIATINRQMLNEKGKEDSIMVIITNSAEKEVTDLNVEEKHVSADDEVVQY